LKVLVIGGTRFIGPFVISQLTSQGHEVAVFNRNQSDTELKNVLQITGDRNQIEDYLEEFQKFGPNVVLDMIPFSEVEAKRTLAVFEGIAERIVAISSTDVYRAYGRLIGTETGDPLETPLLESSPLRERMYPYREQVEEGDWRYYYDKILVEKVYMSSKKIAGTVLRLPMVFGPGDRQHRLFPYLKRVNDSRPYILLDENLAKWRTTRGYIENVAHAIVLAILNQQAKNEIYNVSDYNFNELEWVKLIAESSGWNGTIELVESGKIPLGMKVEQSIDMSSEKIRRQLGYKEIVPLEEGLKKTIQWENSHPPDFISENNFDYEMEDKLVKGKSL
jgi:nucleoside-diphosphate-sugar epimerase